jgi:predicted NBD/HSP70 family sugar kinase
MNLLDIRLVVVGGGLSQSHVSMFDSALATIKQRTLPPIAESARLVKARFHKEAGIYGAAMLGKTIQGKYSLNSL